MIRFLQTTTSLLAAAIILCVTAPTMAAPAHDNDLAACTRSDDTETSPLGVDCTVTGSVGHASQEPMKSNPYPDGPVTMGGGIWF